jgi:GAF domain-containing protein
MHHAIWGSAGGGMSDHDDDPRVRALLRLAREVTARHDLDDVLIGAFRDLRSVVDFGGGSIQLIDDDGWITIAACDPPATSDVMDARVPLGNSVAGRVVLTEQAVYVADAELDRRPIVLPSEEWTQTVRSYLAVPLLADGRAIGLLRVDDARPDAFDAHDRLLIAAAGVVIGAAIQNARAQARSVSARARVDGLERRIDKVRSIVLAAARGGVLNPAQVTELLGSLEQAVGDPPQQINIPAEEPRVAL